MSDPILAAQLYTVRAFTQTAEGLAESLKKVCDIGYTAVQVSGIGPIPSPEVKKMVDDLGLKICITHTPYPALWNETDAVIEQHLLWNCPHVAIGSMPQPYRAEGEAGYKRFASEASAVGEKLAKAGLTFSYHNHSFEFLRFGRRTGLDILFEESDPRYLKGEPDTYWIQHGGGDPAAWIRKLARRCPVVHFKDMMMVEKEGSWHPEQIMAEIGEGNLNWPAILGASKEAGSEYVAVEQDVCRRDPFESLKMSFDYLKAMGLA